MIQKLNQTDFYNVYGISLVCTETSDSMVLKHLAVLLNEIAVKYFEITKYACTAELRYFRRGQLNEGYGEILKHNINLLKKLGIKNWAKERKTLSCMNIVRLFGEGAWGDQYGGMAWLNIAKAVKRLEDLLPVTGSNIESVLSAIDRLNDLEHNTRLYLQDHCSFDLITCLEHKVEADAEEIIRKCSDDVKYWWKEIAI